MHSSDLKSFCCQEMSEALNHQCSQHPDSFDCPDSLIHYSPEFDEYGLVIHDGGSSVQAINYCPWCGSKLPASKRDQWFRTLEALGYDSPSNQEIPKEFLTGEWYAKK
jgi:hypothetical protein